MRKILFCFFLFFCLLQSIAFAQSLQKEINISDTFPVPKENKNMLFYIQRTHNKNTIIYELNYNADSTINENEPVKIYWIRYSDKGEVAPLSYIQRKYAYGLDVSRADKEKNIYALTFVSYKSRTLYLMKYKNEKQYHVYTFINGKLARMSKAFAKIDGGTFWVPHITYVELTGVDPATGKKVVEKIIP
jgi:hypothetical protein